MEILYISSVPSKEQFNYIKQMLKSNINVSKYGMQESGYKFHHLILDGMVENNNKVYSLIGRPISSKSHKKTYWKNVINEENNIIYEHIGLINIPILKNFFAGVSFFFKTLKWIKKNENNKYKCIIIDAAYITIIPFINFATKIKKCPKIAIVCDIYEYMADVKDARKDSKKIHKLISKCMHNQYKKIDGFVFLTEAMNEVLNHNSKPYIIMEGLVDSKMVSKKPPKKGPKKDIIMYAGALREQYGVKNLVEGFMNYANDNAELWIFGAGDYAPVIENQMRKDKRIKFYGIVDNKTVVEKEQQVSLLINPRPFNQEFTKYSFPSKNMEYMVSGTPLLTTKLPGMPQEYYDYVYLINGNSKEDITNSLNEVFSHSYKELREKGLKTREFVLNKKNNVIQSNRIINLCKEVIKNEEEG